MTYPKESAAVRGRTLDLSQQHLARFTVATIIYWGNKIGLNCLYVVFENRTSGFDMFSFSLFANDLTTSRRPTTITNKNPQFEA